MAGFQAQNGSLSQDEEESKSTPAPKFTRQEIFRMKDQMLSFNLEEEGLSSTGSFVQKQERLLEFFYPEVPTNDSGDTPLHNAAQDRPPEDMEVNGTTNPTSLSGDTPLHLAVQVVSTVEIVENGITNPVSDSGDTPPQLATPLHKAARDGLTVEMVDNLSIPELKNFLQDAKLSISGKGAGTGGLSRLLKSRLKQFLSSNNSTDPSLAINPDIPANQGVNPGWFEDLQLNGKLLNRVPKGARINCAKAYCKVLTQLVKNPEDRKSWRALASNRGGRKNNSLATVVNKKIANFEKGIVEKVKTLGSKKKKN